MINDIDVKNIRGGLYEKITIKIDNPLNFNVNIKLPNGKEVLYLNTSETCQGGPEIGKLSIDNNIIKNELFGGPLLYRNGFIYVPCFRKNWFKSGFYLAKINTSTLKIVLISNMHQIIDLVEIENSTIYFYNSLEQNEIQEIPL